MIQYYTTRLRLLQGFCRNFSTKTASDFLSRIRAETAFQMHSAHQNPSPRYNAPPVHRALLRQMPAPRRLRPEVPPHTLVQTGPAPGIRRAQRHRRSARYSADGNRSLPALTHIRTGRKHTLYQCPGTRHPPFLRGTAEMQTERRTRRAAVPPPTAHQKTAMRVPDRSHRCICPSALPSAGVRCPASRLP